MADISIWLEKNRYSVKPEMTTKIGTPINKRKAKNSTISRVVVIALIRFPELR
jgi:hypothetical protein